MHRGSQTGERGVVAQVFSVAVQKDHTEEEYIKPSPASAVPRPSISLRVAKLVHDALDTGRGCEEISSATHKQSVCNASQTS